MKDEIYGDPVGRTPEEEEEARRKFEEADFLGRCAADPAGALEFALTLDQDKPNEKELIEDIVQAVRFGDEFLKEMRQIGETVRMTKPDIIERLDNPDMTMDAVDDTIRMIEKARALARKWREEGQTCHTKKADAFCQCARELEEVFGAECPECHMVGQHKLQCGQRTDGQLRLPATRRK